MVPNVFHQTHLGHRFVTQAEASHMHESVSLAFLQPLFFVASQNHVRVYNLVKQQLVRKLLGGAGRFTSLALHPTGDHVLTGSVSFLPVTACPCSLLSL